MVTEPVRDHIVVVYSRKEKVRGLDWSLTFSIIVMDIRENHLASGYKIIISLIENRSYFKLFLNYEDFMLLYHSKFMAMSCWLDIISCWRRASSSWALGICVGSISLFAQFPFIRSTISWLVEKIIRPEKQAELVKSIRLTVFALWWNTELAALR